MCGKYYSPVYWHINAFISDTLAIARFGAFIPFKFVKSLNTSLAQFWSETLHSSARLDEGKGGTQAFNELTLSVLSTKLNWSTHRHIPDELIPSRFVWHKPAFKVITLRLTNINYFIRVRKTRKLLRTHSKCNAHLPIKAGVVVWCFAV